MLPPPTCTPFSLVPVKCYNVTLWKTSMNHNISTSLTKDSMLYTLSCTLLYSLYSVSWRPLHWGTVNIFFIAVMQHSFVWIYNSLFNPLLDIWCCILSCFLHLNMQPICLSCYMVWILIGVTNRLFQLAVQLLQNLLKDSFALTGKGAFRKQ